MLGGVERVLDNILPTLQQEHDVAVFTIDYFNLGLPHLDSVLKYQPRPKEPLSGRTKRQTERKQLIHLVREMKKWRADIVVLNKSCGLAGWMSQLLDVPLVGYLHDSWSLMQSVPYGAGYSRAKATFLRLLYRYRHLYDSDGLLHRGFGRTRLVICPSSWLAREVRAIYPDVNLKVIPDGVDHSKFRPTRVDKGYALCGGRFSSEKNFELAIHASLLAGCSLVICGSTGQGETHEKAMEYVSRLRVVGGSRVRLDLDIEDSEYIRRLQECSVFLHPGKKEAFGLAPLEAMSCGKPVIALNSSGTPEAVSDGGILLEEDPELWGRELKRIMESENLRAELGEKALVHSEQFTWERTATEIAEALASVGVKR